MIKKYYYNRKPNVYSIRFVVPELEYGTISGETQFYVLRGLSLDEAGVTPPVISRDYYMNIDWDPQFYGSVVPNKDLVYNGTPIMRCIFNVYPQDLPSTQYAFGFGDDHCITNLNDWARIKIICKSINGVNNRVESIEFDNVGTLVSTLSIDTMIIELNKNIFCINNICARYIDVYLYKEEPKSYNINYVNTTGGTFNPKLTSCVEGTTYKLSDLFDITLDSGYSISEISINLGSENISLDIDTYLDWTFEMPSNDITITAKYSSTPDIEYSLNSGKTWSTMNKTDDYYWILVNLIIPYNGDTRFRCSSLYSLEFTGIWAAGSWKTPSQYYLNTFLEYNLRSDPSRKYYMIISNDDEGTDVLYNAKLQFKLK